MIGSINCTAPVLSVALKAYFTGAGLDGSLDDLSERDLRTIPFQVDYLRPCKAHTLWLVPS